MEVFNKNSTANYKAVILFNNIILHHTQTLSYNSFYTLTQLTAVISLTLDNENIRNTNITKSTILIGYFDFGCLAVLLQLIRTEKKRKIVLIKFTNTWTSWTLELKIARPWLNNKYNFEFGMNAV